MHDQAKARFWDKYIEITNRYGVKPNVARWYVKHVEFYIKNYSGLRLNQHSVSEVDKYLHRLGRKSGMMG